MGSISYKSIRLTHRHVPFTYNTFFVLSKQVQLGDHANVFFYLLAVLSSNYLKYTG